MLNVCTNSFSLLPALSLDGIILYAQIVHGSLNGKTVKIGLLEYMNPYPAPNCVLVMDNCAIHHVDGIQELCDDVTVVTPSQPGTPVTPVMPPDFTYYSRSSS